MLLRRYGPLVFNSRKKALPAAGMMVTLLFVPSSEMATLLVDQFVVARFEFCCSTKFGADDGHEMIKLPPDGAMFSDGGAGGDGRTISNTVPSP